MSVKLSPASIVTKIRHWGKNGQKIQNIIINNIFHVVTANTSVDKFVKTFLIHRMWIA